MAVASPPRTDIQSQVEHVPVWWHSIDVGQGVVTPGFKTPEILKKELSYLGLPDLRGKSVLDINTWDGFFAFEAERLGAASVTALDYYVWSMDLKEHFHYWKECLARGLRPGLFENQPYYRPKELPGKIGFDTAHALRKSGVRGVVGDFMSMDLTTLGKFDISFFLGSLYHMRDPFLSLRRLAEVTKELAVIETEAVEFPGWSSRPFCEFFGEWKPNNDSSNYWAPNLQALKEMLVAAGFKKVEVKRGPSAWSRFTSASVARNLLKNRSLSRAWRYRAWVQAWK